jgi:S-(hydroxymethyl)mycothiol dehydrogenase
MYVRATDMVATLAGTGATAAAAPGEGASMEIDAVVVRERGGPAAVERITLRPPGPGEVLVRVLASGVCHSDLHYQQGGLGDDYPYLLGHEGAGIVEATGPGVTAPAAGTYVALTYRAPCLTCRFCATGRLERCVRPAAARDAAVGADGLPVTRALDLGTMATHVVVTAGQAVPVPAACPPEVACLLGCGVATGVGAVLNTAAVPPGSSVAVFGCGGVGANVVQGARLARASTIIAVDLSATKLEQAKRFGATHTAAAGDGDAVAAVRELTGGAGVDFAFDAVGSSRTLAQCVASLDYKGTAVLIGFPRAGDELALPLLPYFYAGSTLRVSLCGDIVPTRDLPLLADWYLRGELDLDRLVSRHIDLGGVDAAFTAMLGGEVLRSVVRC